MDWFKLHTKTIRDPAFTGAEDSEVATWLRLMAYCSEQENGGRISGCFEWKPRQWMGIGIDPSTVASSCGLFCYEGADLIVHFYPTGDQAAVAKKREAGKSGGRPAKAKSRKQKPGGNHMDIPTENHMDTETENHAGNQIREEEIRLDEIRLDEIRLDEKENPPSQPPEDATDEMDIPTQAEIDAVKPNPSAADIFANDPTVSSTIRKIREAGGSTPLSTRDRWLALVRLYGMDAVLAAVPKTMPPDRRYPEHVEVHLVRAPVDDTNVRAIEAAKTESYMWHFDQDLNLMYQIVDGKRVYEEAKQVPEPRPEDTVWLDKASDRFYRVINGERVYE